MNLEYMQEFLVLAETLNYSRAADQLYITQPALSRHMASLEEGMGGKLLERDSHSVRLTPAGRMARTCFQQMLQLYDTTREQVAALSSGSGGILKIGSPYYWTEDFTEQIAARFMEGNPDCRVDIVSCQVEDGLDDLLERRTDVFVCTSSAGIGDEIRRVPYAEEPLCVICMADSELARHDSLRLEDLDGMDLVTMQVTEGVFSDYNPLLTKILGNRGVHPRRVFYTQQVDTLGMTIKRTGGMTIMPYGIRHMDREYLKAIPLEDEGCTLTMCLYYRIDNDNPLIARYVHEALDWHRDDAGDPSSEDALSRVRS